MKGKQPPSRGASSKTLTRLNLECVSKDSSCGMNTFESDTNRLIRSRLTGGSSVCLHDSIVYKNLKLTTMVESLQTFANCLDDTKWIFNESEKLISQLLVEMNDIHEQSTLRRLRIDSIGREYLKLKQRFDRIDMGEIKKIVASYMTDSASVAKPLQQQNLNVKQRKPSLVVNSSGSAKHLNHKQPSGPVVERLEQEATALRNKTVQLESTNFQQQQAIRNLETKLEEKSKQLREKEYSFKKELSFLIPLANDRSQAELSTVDRLKSVLKRIRDSGNQSTDRQLNLQLIDSYIVNLTVLQARIREEIDHRNQSSSMELSQLQTKKHLLRSQINSLEMQSANLRDQRQAVEAYINKLQSSYEQRRRTEQMESFNTTTKSIRPLTKTTSTMEPELYMMLMAQAETIEQLLSPND